MLYLIALIMGYFAGTNALVQKQAMRFAGTRFANPVMGTLSALGALGGWFCILPAAYFVGSDYGNGFLEGFYFVMASLGGVLVSGMLQIAGLNYLLAAITVFVNIGLAILVYTMT
ncbi:hypothetical protein [Marinobacter sp. X15-166B]|uniref:hypothetical protein n=1 Tax=Marinobacter sp. X15-166B TaxID=1897620 RepID=UPI00085C7E8E|nr:hypothetical protein [Marinobacter sp. X15-166B]OEY65995.1 hypothetical protein BG841_05675 [Marinobacter sp. X15-166B]